MAGAHKSEVGQIDGTPVKRMFWSIISDYGLQTGICELVDNALDLWRTNRERTALRVEIELNIPQQIITISDNAGGVKQDELQRLIVPGGSGNSPEAHLIGIFGVGSKRAGVALGENVKIRTRHKRAGSYEIEVSTPWLQSDDWTLPYYEIPEIKPSTTFVEISRLRNPITDDDVESMRAHLGETYDWFIQRGCIIEVNGTPVQARSFENWTFPKGHSPKCAQFDIELTKGNPITVEITGGLIADRVPDADNYGAYFYCNERLIVKELRDRQVGYFVSAEAGVPHPDASLCRVIVRMEGPAQHMPWNSSKSGINYGHVAFGTIRPTLIQLTSHFSSLSRRLKHDWTTAVFPFQQGTIEEIKPVDLSVKNPLVLPPLPKVNKPRVEKLKTRNKKQIEQMPWVLGLVEVMDAVELVARQRYQTGNRIALLLLDSNFEISLKEFIVHNATLFPTSQYTDTAIAQLFKNRPNVVADVTKKVPALKPYLVRVQHYYSIRNKLIHERATVDPTDADITNYQKVIAKILKILFKLSV